MSRYALISKSVVVTVVEAPDGWVNPGAETSILLSAGADVHTGDTWDGSTFTVRPPSDAVVMKMAHHLGKWAKNIANITTSQMTVPPATLTAASSLLVSGAAPTDGAAAVQFGTIASLVGTTPAALAASLPGMLSAITSIDLAAPVCAAALAAATNTAAVVAACKAFNASMQDAVSTLNSTFAKKLPSELLTIRGIF